MSFRLKAIWYANVDFFDCHGENKGCAVKKAVMNVADGFWSWVSVFSQFRFLFLEKILQRFTGFHQLFRLFRSKQGVGKSVFRL